MKKKNIMKRVDLFKGSKGCLLVFIIVAIFVIANFFTVKNTSNILWTVFLFIFAGLCLWNYSSCSRVHCQITGWGFLAVGILALLQVLGFIPISFNVIWAIFIVVLVIGYGYEFLHKGKTGSCYVERKS